MWFVNKRYFNADDFDTVEKIRKHLKRHKEGMARFGKTMSDNDKPYKDWVKDAQEESMDFILYLEKTLK